MGSVITSKAGNRGDITEEVIGGTEVTERQFESNEDDAQRNYPKGHHELKADLVGHKNGIAQWVVNGSVLVIRRGSHDEAVVGYQVKERKHLCGSLRRKMVLLCDSKSTIIQEMIATWCKFLKRRGQR